MLTLLPTTLQARDLLDVVRRVDLPGGLRGGHQGEVHQEEDHHEDHHEAHLGVHQVRAVTVTALHKLAC